MLSQPKNNIFYQRILILLVCQCFALSTFGQFKINAKKPCLYHAWSFGGGNANNSYLNAEKTLGIKNKRKINLGNKSEFTYLGLGLITFQDRSPNAFYIGPTVHLQFGFAKFKHLWPTLRYTHIINEPRNPNRLNIGLSWLPIGDCGIAYAYTVGNNAHTQYQLKHHIGVILNIRHRKIMCIEPKKDDKKNKK